MTPIHPDAVRLEHEEIGRFGAIGAVCRAAGLNFCVTLGGSETFQPVPPLSLLQNVKEQGADAPFYYTLPCIDFNARKTFNPFCAAAKTSKRRVHLVGRAERREALLFSS